MGNTQGQQGAGAPQHPNNQPQPSRVSDTEFPPRDRTHSEDRAPAPARRAPEPTQPMSIGGGAATKQETNAWDDDDDIVAGMPQLNIVSQSAPVYSHRFPRDMPQRPVLKPIEEPQIKEVEEIALPPPSLPDRLPFTMGHHNEGAISQSVPLSRSLLQSTMSLPPRFAGMEAAAKNSTGVTTSSTIAVATRPRHGSIFDLISAENVAHEPSSEPKKIDDESSALRDSDDEDLPFR